VTDDVHALLASGIGLGLLTSDPFLY